MEELIRVRLLADLGGVWVAGRVVAYPVVAAHHLVAHGQAEAIDPLPEPELKPETEATAEAAPAVRNAARRTGKLRPRKGGV